VALTQQAAANALAVRVETPVRLSRQGNIDLSWHPFAFWARTGKRLGAHSEGHWIMSRRLRAVALAVAGVCVCSVPALAETQISVFGGANWNFSSDVKATGVPDYTVDWDGKSFEMPPYWGVRGTYWLSPSSNWGFAIDYAHQKAVADLDSAAGESYDRLEFTNGNNVLLLEVLYRFSPAMNGTLVPYVGAGIGVTIPHVEVTFAGEGPRRTSINSRVQRLRFWPGWSTSSTSRGRSSRKRD
jgi:lipid A oxidase